MPLQIDVIVNEGHAFGFKPFAHHERCLEMHAAGELAVAIHDTMRGYIGDAGIVSDGIHGPSDHSGR